MKKTNKLCVAYQTDLKSIQIAFKITSNKLTS
jgi:hypothetical protein